jgi:hypothetical protein
MGGGVREWGGGGVEGVGRGQVPHWARILFDPHLVRVLFMDE